MEVNTNRKNRNREDIKKTLSDEAAINDSIEKFFSEDQIDRLSTMLPSKIKRDMIELNACIDTKGTGARNSSNRLLTEALVDLFKKYKAGDGEFKLNQEPHYRGDYPLKD